MLSEPQFLQSGRKGLFPHNFRHLPSRHALSGQQGWEVGWESGDNRKWSGNLLHSIGCTGALFLSFQTTRELLLQLHWSLFYLNLVCSFGFQAALESRPRDMRGGKKKPQKITKSLFIPCVLVPFPGPPAALYCSESDSCSLHSV